MTVKTKPTPTMSVRKLSIAMDAASSLVVKHIASIQTRGAKLDHDIHSGAMACLWHAAQHGDITLMNRLLLAVPKSARRNALAQWACAFGQFTANESKETKAESPLVFLKRTTDLVGAEAKPFWDFKNVPEGTAEWQCADFVGRMIKTLEKQAALETEQGRKAGAVLAALKAVPVA